MKARQSFVREVVVLTTVLLSIATAMPVHTHAQTPRDSDRVWVATDMTAQPSCTATWSAVDEQGTLLKRHDGSCAAGTVVQVILVDRVAAEAAHMQYVPENASPAERDQFVHRVVALPQSSPHILANTIRPNTDCPPGTTYHAIVQATVNFGVPGQPGASSARVQVDQAYTQDPSCSTKYAGQDTVSYISGPSGAWKYNATALFDDNLIAYDNDPAGICAGLPHTASFNNYAIAASRAVATTPALWDNSACSGGYMVSYDVVNDGW